MTIKILPKFTRINKANKLERITNTIITDSRKTLAPEIRSQQNTWGQLFGITIKELTANGSKATKYKDGIKISETIRTNGSKKFEKTFFEEDGKISEIKKYTDGFFPKLNEYTIFNNGNKYKTVEFLADATKSTKFYENGSPRIIKTESNEKYLQKQAQYFNINGNLIRDFIEKNAYGKHITDTYMRDNGTLLTRIDSYDDKYFYQVHFSKDGKKITHSKSWEETQK